MTWEYPYHSGQAQEDLPDRLVPESLYGLKVVTPGYLSASDRPATATQALVPCDSGKGYADHISDTDVNTHDTPAGYDGQGHLGRALFVCPQPECTVARGHSFLFETLEQGVAHWNTSHVAVASLFNCMVNSCNFETAAAADSLDALFRHFIDAYPSLHANGKWQNLVELVVRGLHVKPNTQYWPPSTPLGDLQCPVAIKKPSVTQLQSPIAAARWAACKNFHKAVVSCHRSYRRAQHEESKSRERSSSASKGAPKAPSESGAQTFSKSADEWAWFRHSADEAATAARKVKSSSQKGGKSSGGQGGTKDSKSSASTVTKSGSGKGSRRTRKEDGLAEKLCWDTSYKIPKRPEPDTSISSEARTPCKADKHKQLRGTRG